VAEAAVLTGPAEARLELSVTGYKHAGGTKNDFDGNWVVIAIEARDAARAWSASDPAFLTWEVLELIGWLREIADGADDGRGFSGLEGTLQFEAADLDGQPALTAIFIDRLAPEDAGDEYQVPFRPGADGIRRFAEGIVAQMAEYPIRVIEPSGYASKIVGS